MGGGKGGEEGGVESANLALSPTPSAGPPTPPRLETYPANASPVCVGTPQNPRGPRTGWGLRKWRLLPHLPAAWGGRAGVGRGGRRARAHTRTVVARQPLLPPPVSTRLPFPSASPQLTWPPPQGTGGRRAGSPGGGRGSGKQASVGEVRASRVEAAVHSRQTPFGRGGGSPARPRPATPAGPAPGCKRHPHDWLTIVGTRATVRPAALWARDQSRTADTSVKTCGRGMGAAMRCGDAGWRAGLGQGDGGGLQWRCSARP